VSSPKILLINLPSPPCMNVDRDSQGGFGVARPTNRQTYGGRMNVRPPLFLAYAASLLKKHGFETLVYDALNLELDLHQVLSKVKREEPDIIVATVSLPSIYGDVALLKEIKEIRPNTTIIATGAVCTTLPDDVFSGNAVDIAVGAELEYTLLDLVRTINKGASTKKIRSIRYKEDGEIFSTGPQSFIENLDKLPFPAYDLLPMHIYQRKVGKELVPFFTVLTSRGCPYQCPYCPYPVGYGKEWRARSVKNVVDELKLLAEKHKIKSLIFRDQVLTFDMERAERLCEEIIREGIDIRWICETRVDHVNRNLLLKMRKAGCMETRFGVETGEPEMLKTVGKPGASIEDTRKAFKLAGEAGIKRAAHLIVGFPDDNWETVRKTAKFLEEIEPDEINVFIMTLYPETKMFEEAEKGGWILTYDWSKYTVHTPVMKTKYFEANEIEEACEYIFNSFRISRKLKRIRKNPFYLFPEMFKLSNIKWAFRTISSRFRKKKKGRND
jgi:anaerobic magnesium-protoporphyrin IX monomethyl ester cyclase